MLKKEKMDGFGTEFQYMVDKITPKVSKIPEIKHYEVIGSIKNSIEISYEKAAIKYSQNSLSKGVGLRILGKNGKEGMTYTTNFNESSVEKIITDAVKMMKVATENKDFKDIAYPSKSYSNFTDIYDNSIEKIELEDLKDNFAPIFNLTKKKYNVSGLSGDFSARIGAFHLHNSNGIDLSDKYALASISCNLTIVDKAIPSNGFDWQVVSQLKELNSEKIAEKSYKMAEKGLIKQSVKTKTYPIILSPRANAQLLIKPLLSAINAEAIQNNRSFLVDKQGEKIGSDKFSIEDNPHLEGKLGSIQFDGEGIASKKMDVLKEGVLKDVFHNTFTASKDDRESNAHASRKSYQSQIGITNTNILMEPGQIPKEELISNIKEGIYFDMTGDRPNLITGDFSGLIMVGYIINNGELGPALLETLIGINLFEAYNKIEKLSKEREWISEMHLPWVQLDNVQISSRN